jgi:transposase-like protein
MSKKRRNFISESKSKIIMEMLENGMSINEIASKHNLHPKTVQLWKKQFIENLTSRQK